jgi:hypothetical protein
VTPRADDARENNNRKRGRTPWIETAIIALDGTITRACRRAANS